MKGNQAVTLHFKREYTSGEVTLAVYVFKQKFRFFTTGSILRLKIKS